MIQEFSNKLLRQLEDELGRISVQIIDPNEKRRVAIKTVRMALDKLRTYFTDKGFSSENEEIHFFKTIKPAFYKWRIYFAELCVIESNIPIGDADCQKIFFEGELRVVERILGSYPFQYQYYKMHLSELDRYYFLRKGNSFEFELHDLPDPDPVFAAPGDYLFSKIRAYEMLREWLAERITFLKKHPMLIYQAGEVSTDLRWTGEKVHLAELAYALQLSGQINNGQAGVAQIFRWLEEHLAVSIGIPAKRLSEIKARKRLSRTQFLDNLKHYLIQKMDLDETN